MLYVGKEIYTAHDTVNDIFYTTYDIQYTTYEYVFLR